VSLRTLYRDIETLREQGVTVEGKAGTGYQAVLSEDLRSTFEHSALVVGPGPQASGTGLELGLVRQAIRERHRIRIEYKDLKGRVTQREVWPVP